MLSSSFFDVAIGIVFVFLLLSLIASTVNEIIASFMTLRGKQLLLGLQTLLNDTGVDVNGLVARLYNDGQIFGLFQGEFNAQDPRNLPSYIPSKNFAMAMLNIVPGAAGALPDPDPMPAALQTAEQVAQQATQAAQQAAQAVTQLSNQQPPAPPDQLTAAEAAAVKAAATARLACLRRDAIKLANHDATKKLGVPLLSMIDSAAADFDKLKGHLEDWYNSAMDRVSGWYKNHTQRVLFVIGVVLAIALNADTINIVQQLSKNPTLRESVVAAAQAYQPKKPAETKSDQTKPDQTKPDQTNNTQGQANTGQEANPDLAKSIKAVSDQVKDVEALGIPLGWNGLPEGFGGWAESLVGWLLTAIAVSLGAPFWFDILNKFMVVRSTVKPGEKTQEGRRK